MLNSAGNEAMKTLIILALILFTLLTYMTHGQTYSDITYDAGTTLDIGTGADVCATNIYINGSYSGSGTICSSALPVTMLSFTHSVDKNNIRLMWATEAELNNSGFDVERKEVKEGSHWQKIGFVYGNGTTNEPRNYIFEDKKLKTGKYSFRLKQIDYNGNFEYFLLEAEVNITPPVNFYVSQNYPNPSNPKSKIDYQLPSDGKVIIRIYDIQGREVLVVVNEVKQAGYYTSEFDGSSLASGVYFYRIEAGKFNDVRKMILVK